MIFKPRPRIASIVVCFFVLTIFPAWAQDPILTASPAVEVSTISGSGVTGTVDGSPSKTKFIEPFGVVYDESGRLYVSDAGAQRIRIVERDGFTSTLAGSGELISNGLWVRGGYQDGAGLQARFNGPAGLAIGRDKALYVADANNHCIRRIDASGIVSTYAGRAGVAGHDNGPRATATFERPTALSTDSSGNLYVADFFGIRVISPSGVVTTLSGFGKGAFGVSVVNTASGTVVFAADELGLTRLMPDGSVERFAATGTRTEARDIQGNLLLGHPFAIAAFDERSVAYTDVRSNTVRYLNWTAGALQTLAGVPVEDGAASGGGYRDGAGSAARFDAPLGIVASNDGTLVVADGANKRLRKIAKLDRSHDARLGASNALPTVPKRRNLSAYQIAFVGNSFLWQYTRWADSIQGIVEKSLIAVSGKTAIAIDPYVFPGSALGVDEQYIELLAKGGVANFYVLNINPGNVFPAADLTDALQLDNASRTWEPLVTTTLRRLNRTLNSLHVGLLVYITPLPQNISPVETVWPQLLSSDGQTTPDVRLGTRLDVAVRDSGVEMVDLWKVFEADVRSARHEPLFGTDDVHFSYHGRSVVARELVKWFKQKRPWRTMQ